jgi:hypothetical protein
MFSLVFAVFCVCFSIATGTCFLVLELRAYKEYRKKSDEEHRSGTDRMLDDFAKKLKDQINEGNRLYREITGLSTFLRNEGYQVSRCEDCLSVLIGGSDVTMPVKCTSCLSKDSEQSGVGKLS